MLVLICNEEYTYKHQIAELAVAEAAVTVMQKQVAVIKYVQELAKGRDVSFYWDGNKKLNNLNK